MPNVLILAPAAVVNPEDIAAKFTPVLHIHATAPQIYLTAAFVCGTPLMPQAGRVARHGELVTCVECKRLIARIRGDYTYLGRRRAVAIKGDTHS